MWLSTPSKCPENAKKQHESNIKTNPVGFITDLCGDHIAVSRERGIHVPTGSRPPVLFSVFTWSDPRSSPESAACTVYNYT